MGALRSLFSLWTWEQWLPSMYFKLVTWIWQLFWATFRSLDCLINANVAVLGTNQSLYCPIFCYDFVYVVQNFRWGWGYLLHRRIGYLCVCILNISSLLRYFEHGNMNNGIWFLPKTAAYRFHQTVPALVNTIVASTLQDLVFLRRLYPRLQVWFDWFNTTQVSGGLGTRPLRGIWFWKCKGQWVWFGCMGQFKNA